MLLFKNATMIDGRQHLTHSNVASNKHFLVWAQRDAWKGIASMRPAGAVQ